MRYRYMITGKFTKDGCSYSFRAFAKSKMKILTTKSIKDYEKTESDRMGYDSLTIYDYKYMGKVK